MKPKEFETETQNSEFSQRSENAGFRQDGGCKHALAGSAGKVVVGKNYCYLFKGVLVVKTMKFEQNPESQRKLRRCGNADFCRVRGPRQA